MPLSCSRIVRVIRFGLIALWIAIVAVCTAGYLLDPSGFTPETVAAFIARFNGAVWFVYIALSALRGLTLLPSTPLVLAGTMLFPDQAAAVLGVSLAGILLSSAMIYKFSDLLGFSGYFERHKPQTIRRMRTRLEHPLGFLFVIGWAFFPLAPTDLVCYIAGVTRMHFPKFIVAIGLGELILCTFYVYLGGSIVRLMP